VIISPDTEETGLWRYTDGTNEQLLSFGTTPMMKIRNNWIRQDSTTGFAALDHLYRYNEVDDLWEIVSDVPNGIVTDGVGGVVSGVVPQLIDTTKLFFIGVPDGTMGAPIWVFDIESTT
jgi:hypothetical protein